jgi:serine/threonine protein kinase
MGKYYKEVFVCKDMKNDNKEVVIKLEKIGSNQISRLENECNFYKRLSSSDCFAFVLNYFNDTHFRYLAMRPLGLNLQKFFENKKTSGQWNLEDVVKCADQMISRVANCHLRNIIHRDIKPENFVVDANDSNSLFLIDFNLAKEYRDQNLVHIPYIEREAKFSVGNVQFLSINAHLGKEQSRRDDLCSLGYALISLAAKDGLPWNDVKYINFKTREQYLEAVKNRKLNCSIDQLCQHLPKQFNQYMNYCSKLGFYENPDYIKLRLLFKHLFNDLQKQKLNTNQTQLISSIDEINESTNSKVNLSQQIIRRMANTSPVNMRLI